MTIQLCLYHRLCRRHFSRVAVLFTACLCLCTPARADFELYDEIRMRQKPSLSRWGFKELDVIYAAEFWPGKKVTEEPDLDHVKKMISRRKRPTNDVLCLDIEHWDIDRRRVDSNTLNTHLERYRSVAETVRSAMPGVAIGYYGAMPVRDYFSPVRAERNLKRRTEYTQWQETNRLLEPLASAVDIVFPSLYTFYKDPDGWETYARANIEQARRYGKKVIVFLWPQYHQSNRLRRGNFIDPGYWRRQLELAYAHADGLVIWSPYTGAPNWDENAGWWQATKDFVRAHDLAPTAPPENLTSNTP